MDLDSDEEQPQEQPRRRRVFEKTILETVIMELGEEVVLDHYITAVDDAKPALLVNYPTEASFKHVYDVLVQHRKFITLPINAPPPSLTTVHKVYLQWAQSSLATCLLHTGAHQNGYPVVSLRTSRNPSTKLQLHQLHPFIKEHYKVVDGCFLLNKEFKFWEKKHAASHRCHRKLCLSHTYKALKSENTAREHCRPLLIIDNSVVIICMCSPSCLDMSKQAYTYSQ